MKFKHCFTLAVILIILFSLGFVAAGENVTAEESSDGTCLAVDDGASQGSVFDDVIAESDEGQNTIEEISSTADDDAVDVQIRIDVKNVFEGKEYNRPGFIVPWNITVTVTGGVAHNVTVGEIILDNLVYISHNVTAGTYDPTGGVWEIGDLDSSKTAFLRIYTMIEKDDISIVAVNATTSSADVDLSNNFDCLLITGGTAKFGSNVTHESNDDKAPQHYNHYPSSGSGRFKIIDEEEKPAEDDPNPPSDPEPGEKDPDPDNGPGSGSGGDSGSKGNPSPNSKVKNTANANALNSAVKTVGLLTSSVSDSLNNIFRPAANGGSGSKANISSKAIRAYDYTKVPILIFAAFLVLLIGTAVLDKVKS